MPSGADTQSQRDSSFISLPRYNGMLTLALLVAVFSAFFVDILDGALEDH